MLKPVYGGLLHVSLAEVRCLRSFCQCCRLQTALLPDAGPCVLGVQGHVVTECQLQLPAGLLPSETRTTTAETPQQQSSGSDWQCMFPAQWYPDPDMSVPGSCHWSCLFAAPPEVLRTTSKSGAEVVTVTSASGVQLQVKPDCLAALLISLVGR